MDGVQLQAFPVQVRPSSVRPGDWQGNARRSFDLWEPGGWRAGGRYAWWDPNGFSQQRGDYAHKAADIIAPLGSRVVAAREGVVLQTWTYRGQERPGAGFNETAGHYVRVAASDRTGGGTDQYSHLLKAPRVRPGQRVAAGQWLGFVGQTGSAEGTAPHLHLGTRDARGRAVDVAAQLAELHAAGGWKVPPGGAVAAIAGTVLALLTLRRP